MTPQAPFVVVLLLAMAGCAPADSVEATGALIGARADDSPAPAEPDETPLEPVIAHYEVDVHQRNTSPVDARVVDILLSDAGDTQNRTIGRPTTGFDPTDTVYAEIRTAGTASEYDIYAKWLSPDKQVLSDYGVRVSEAGTTYTVISLSKPDGWARGVHSVEVAINGKTERIVTFEVP